MQPFLYRLIRAVIQYTLHVQSYPPLRYPLLHSEYRDFNNGVCHIMKITAEINLTWDS